MIFNGLSNKCKCKSLCQNLDISNYLLSYAYKAMLEFYKTRQYMETTHYLRLHPTYMPP